MRWCFPYRLFNSTASMEFAASRDFEHEVRLCSDTLFEKWSTKGYREMYVRGIRIAEQVDVIEMLIQDRGLHYLDLAVKPSLRSKEKGQVKYETIRNLPPAYADYATAESDIRETSTLGRLLTAVNRIQMSRFRSFEFSQNLFKREMYKDFKRIFFERFEDGIQRTSIRGFLNAYRLLQINVFSKMVYQSLLLACITPEPDPTLTIELLRTLCISRRSKMRAFLETPPDSLETMLCHAKSMRFDFWGLWRGIGDLSEKFNPIVEFMAISRSQCVIILLKYGFPYACDGRIYEKLCFQLVCRKVRNRFIISYEDYIQLREKKNWARMVLIMIAFMAFAGFGRTEGTSPNSISTLVCLMRCVPDPYVDHNEMLRELKPVVLESFVDDLQKITDSYAAAHVYDEVCNVYTPRALAHLCRCVIRRAIANNLRLPEGINELEMPKKIREYLSLES